MRGMRGVVVLLASLATLPACLRQPEPAQLEPGRQYALRSLGESNSVLQIYPGPRGTTLYLRDGTSLLVPPSVNIPSTLFEGSRIYGTFERVGDQNVVTELNVIPRNAHDPGN